MPFSSLKEAAELGPSQLANAHVIAAAPELLDACEGIIGMIYRDKYDIEAIEFDDYEAAEAVCRAAIRKARGLAA